MRQRVLKAQEALRQTDNDLILLCDRENLIYFTGITEIECGGLIIPRDGEPVLITLWLDLPFFHGRTNLPLEGYVYRKETLAQKIAAWINSRGYRAPKIMFSKYFVEVGVFTTLLNLVPGLSGVDGSLFFYQLRAVKDATELGYIRKASEIVSVGMKAAIDSLKPGMSETEVLGAAEYAMRNHGSQGHPFRMQVLDESRQMMVHPIATDQTLRNNQYVVIHLGAVYQGYVSKMCRSVALGKANPQKEALYHLTVEAQKAAISAAVPGASCDDVYQAAKQILSKAKMEKYLIDDIGYGIGIRQSEFSPIIGKNRKEKLQTGMAIDLMFPSVYHPQYGGTRIADVVFVGNPPEVVTNYNEFPAITSIEG